MSVAAPDAFTLTTVKAAMALIERYADKFKAFGQLQFKKGSW